MPAAGEVQVSDLFDVRQIFPNGVPETVTCPCPDPTPAFVTTRNNPNKTKAYQWRADAPHLA
jgi:hypothetical protein